MGLAAGGSRRVGGSAAMTTMVCRERAAGFRVGGGVVAEEAAGLPPGTRVASVVGSGEAGDGDEGGADVSAGSAEAPGIEVGAGLAGAEAGAEAGAASSPRQPDTASRQTRPRAARRRPRGLPCPPGWCAPWAGGQDPVAGARRLTVGQGC